MAVVGGLSHSSISRLKETHSHVSPETIKVPGAGGAGPGLRLPSQVWLPWELTAASTGHSCPHLTGGETEAWRDQMLFPCYTVKVAARGLTGLPDSKACVFSSFYLA